MCRQYVCVEVCVLISDNKSNNILTGILTFDIDIEYMAMARIGTPLNLFCRGLVTCYDTDPVLAVKIRELTVNNSLGHWEVTREEQEKKEKMNEEECLELPCRDRILLSFFTNPSQVRTGHYGSIRVSTIQCGLVQVSMGQYNSIRVSTVQYESIRISTGQFRSILVNTSQYESVWVNKDQ